MSEININETKAVVGIIGCVFVVIGMGMLSYATDGKFFENSCNSHCHHHYHWW